MTAPFVIPPDHPALPGHFPGRPVVPGVLLLDRVAQAAHAAYGLGVPCGVPRAKFAAPVLPGDVVSVVLDRRGPDRVAFTLSAGGRVVAAGEMAFAP